MTLCVLCLLCHKRPHQWTVVGSLPNFAGYLNRLQLFRNNKKCMEAGNLFLNHLLEPELQKSVFVTVQG